MSTLDDELARLALTAPVSTTPAGSLWRAGRRRHLAHRVGVTASVLSAAGMVAAGWGLASSMAPPTAPQATSASMQTSLAMPARPAVVVPPGPWSRAAGPEADLAAVGLAERNTANGLRGVSTEVALFGVHAQGARSVWIDLPGTDVSSLPLSGWYALSPEGALLAWERRSKDGGALTGWAVMNTFSRKVTEIPLQLSRGRPMAYSAQDLRFSGDGRHLMVTIAFPDLGETRNHQSMAVDVERGDVTLIEPVGTYWVPSRASSPEGVAWARGNSVYVVDPPAPEPLVDAARRHVMDAEVLDGSWAPDGRRFAWISRPTSHDPTWTLHVGRTLAVARSSRPVEVDGAPLNVGEILGWADNDHVVVDADNTFISVDVRTGSVSESLGRARAEGAMSVVRASGLWGAPVADPAPREGLTDPRPRWLMIGGSSVIVLLGGLLFGLARWRRA